jgi:RecA-family ATPase
MRKPASEVPRAFRGDLACEIGDADDGQFGGVFAWVTVLLLAHPSLVGLSSGSGTSGSTGWHNSVRSRLYLDKVKTSDGEELDANVRFLTCKKANYGVRPTALRLRWDQGCFTLDGQAESLGPEARLDVSSRHLLERAGAESVWF